MVPARALIRDLSKSLAELLSLSSSSSGASQRALIRLYGGWLPTFSNSVADVMSAGSQQPRLPQSSWKSLWGDSNTVRGLAPIPQTPPQGKLIRRIQEKSVPAGAAHGALCRAMLPSQGLWVLGHKSLQEQQQ